MYRSPHLPFKIDFYWVEGRGVCTQATKWKARNSLGAISTQLTPRKGIFGLTILLKEADYGHKELCRSRRMLSINNICSVLHITRQPNSVIVLLFIENISKFLTSSWLSSKHLLVSQHSFRLWNEQMFFPCRYSSKSRWNPSSNVFWVSLHYVAFCFSQQLGYFVFEQPWTLLPFS